MIEKGKVIADLPDDLFEIFHKIANELEFVISKNIEESRNPSLILNALSLVYGTYMARVLIESDAIDLVDKIVDEFRGNVKRICKKMIEQDEQKTPSGG